MGRDLSHDDPDCIQYHAGSIYTYCGPSTSGLTTDPGGSQLHDYWRPPIPKYLSSLSRPFMVPGYIPEICINLRLTTIKAGTVMGCRATELILLGITRLVSIRSQRRDNWGSGPGRSSYSLHLSSMWQIVLGNWSRRRHIRYDFVVLTNLDELIDALITISYTRVWP